MLKLRVLRFSKELSNHLLQEDKSYIVGRSSDCDITIDDESLSRQHFRIFFENNQWNIEKLSKFGALLRGEDPVNSPIIENFDVIRVPPYEFQFEQVEEKIEVPSQLHEPISNDADIANSQNLSSNESSNSLQSINIEEKTTAGLSRLLAYIKIYYQDSEEELRLEGITWVIGRDDGCEIVIKDKRASRQHIRLYREGERFYAKDLGSSNGSLLNSKALSKDDAQVLESGDVLEIGETKLQFELRDPLFDSEPTTESPMLPAITTNNGVVYVPLNLPVANETYPSAGAIRMDLQQNSTDKNKKIRFYLVGIVALLLSVAVLQEMSNQNQQQELASKSQEKKDPFESLSPQDKEFVQRTYKLAKNLYLQTKYEMALAEVRKLHEKLPSYLDSREIEQLCETALDTIANKKYEEELEKKRIDAISQAAKIIKDCQDKFSKSENLEAAQLCLQPGIEIDPENKGAEKLLADIQLRIEQRDLEKLNRSEWLRRVQQRESIYNRAVNLQKQGKYLDAIETYDRHIASTLPDPKKLESKSEENKKVIKEEIKQTLESAVAEAETAMSQNDYRTAVMRLEKALALDPNQKKARDIYDQASLELRKNMKGLFSDSVVEESLGNVESAKVKWKKIVELDVPNGEYFQKAKIKLKKYGE